MEPRSARPEDAPNVVPLRVAGELPPSLEELAERAMRIAVGMTAATVDVLIDAVARSTGGPTPHGPGRHGGDTIPLVAGATLGIAAALTRRAARAMTTVVRTGELVLSPVTTSAPFRDGMRRLRTELDTLDSRWREERPREQEAAQAFVGLLIPEVVDAVLDQVDLDTIVAERVDVERVIARVDLNAIIERVDLDRILQRVDLSAIVERLPLDEVIARIDVDEIVAKVDLDRVVERIDVDEVAARLDVEAVVRRLDLAAIAREVVDELDLPEIIRESMGSMTTETVGGIRVQSMNADRAIARLVDRLLQRRRTEEPTNDSPEDPA